MERKKPNLLKNAVLNTIKSCCSIIFPMIVFPYVSRVLTPDGYGRITFGSTIMTVIATIAALGVSEYAVREGAKKRSDKAELSAIASEVFTINILSTIAAFLVFALILVFWPGIAGYRVLISIQVSYVIFYTLGTEWLNAIHEDYRILTIRYIVFHTLSIICTFLFVKDSGDVIIYATITVLASIIPSILNIFYIRKEYGIKINFAKPARFKKHIKPIMILFASSAAALIYVNTDIIILKLFENEFEVGLYGEAAKIYTLVKHVLQAFLYVAIPKVSNDLANGRKEEAQKQLNSVLRALITLALPACAGMFVLSRNIILIAGGKEYAGAESSLAILAVTLIFSTISCFYNYVVLVPLGKEKFTMIATSVSALLNIILNFILIPVMGRDAAALTTLLSEVVMVIFGIIFTRKDLKFNIWRSLLAGILSAAGVVATYLVLRMFSINYILEAVICIVVSVALYVLIMYIINRDELNGILKMVKKK